MADRNIGSSHRKKVLVALGVFALAAALYVLYDVLDERFDAAFLEEVIHRYGYYAIVGVTLLGNVGVPVPEESTVLLSGMAARQGWLSYPWVFGVCTVSAIIGDALGYMIGRTGGRGLILGYGRYVGVTKEKSSGSRHFLNGTGAKPFFSRASSEAFGFSRAR